MSDLALYATLGHLLYTGLCGASGGRHQQSSHGCSSCQTEMELLPVPARKISDLIILLFSKNSLITGS